MEEDEKKGFAWPSKFEALFGSARSPDSSWVFNACMDGRPTIGRYALGYRTGAELLFKYLAATGEREHNDVVVYPIVFCWRQYLELTLKQTVVMVRRLTGTSGPAKLDKHGLLGLWRELLPHYPSLDASPGEVESVGRAIEYLDRYDADSFAFRYPTSKRGESTQADIPAHINLRKLNDIMQGIANWLDAGVDLLSNRLDAEAEMQAVLDEDADY